MKALESGANPAVLPPDDLEDYVHQALRLVSRAGRVEYPAWEPPCLVAGYLAEHAGALRDRALRQVLRDALDQLTVDSPIHGDALLAHYWEGLTVPEMMAGGRPRGPDGRHESMAESTLYLCLREARKHFTAVLWEREQQCVLAAATAGLDSAPAVALVAEASKGAAHAAGWLLVGTVGLVVAAVAWRLAPLQTPLPALATSTAAQSPPSASVSAPPSTAAQALVCGESIREEAPPTQRLLRSQGVSSFTSENTGGLSLSNWIRAVAIDRRGAWLGYFSNQSGPNGLGQFNKKDWADCNRPEGAAGMNVNDIAIDDRARVWVAAEKVGVAMFNGSTWHRFTTADGLPSADTFSLTVDEAGAVWVGTWDGVAKYDGNEWSVPYTMNNGTLFDNHVHAVAFDSVGNIWIGHIKAGVSQYRVSDGSWVHHTEAEGHLSGDQVRAILVRPERGQHPEQVWIATADGGVSVFEKGTWIAYRAEDGLPSNDVRDLTVDRYDRLWAATSGGVSFFDDRVWRTYHTLDAYSLAIGPDCTDCPFDTDQVLSGTRRNGLTHSRIPLDTSAVEIVDVTYPTVVAPGQSFVPEVVVAPIEPYKLREEKGDMLINTDEDPALLFGAYEHIAVKGVVDAGKAYIFSAPDTPFVAPELPDGVDEQTFTSTWRVWMHTRYVGPPVHITFTVRRSP